VSGCRFVQATQRSKQHYCGTCCQRCASFSDPRCSKNSGTKEHLAPQKCTAAAAVVAGGLGLSRPDERGGCQRASGPDAGRDAGESSEHRKSPPAPGGPWARGRGRGVSSAGREMRCRCRCTDHPSQAGARRRRRPRGGSIHGNAREGCARGGKERAGNAPAHPDEVKLCALVSLKSLSPDTAGPDARSSRPTRVQGATPGAMAGRQAGDLRCAASSTSDRVFGLAKGGGFQAEVRAAAGPRAVPKRWAGPQVDTICQSASNLL